MVQGMTHLQGYSQKQLSNVSVRNYELLRLVKSPIKPELDQLELSDAQCATRLRKAFQGRESFHVLSARRTVVQTELSSKNSQIESLKAEIGDLPPAQKVASRGFRDSTGWRDGRRGDRTQILQRNESRDIHMPRGALNSEGSKNQDPRPLAQTAR